MLHRNRQLDLLALGLFAASLLTGAALATYDPLDPPSTLLWPERAEISNACGRAGAWFAHRLYALLGFPAWFVAASLAGLAVRLVAARPVSQPALRTFGWLATLVALCTLASTALSRSTPGPEIGAGGYVGALGRVALESHFALAGAWILTLSLLAAGLLLCTDYVVFRAAAGATVASGAALARWSGVARRVGGSSGGRSASVREALKLADGPRHEADAQGVGGDDHEEDEEAGDEEDEQYEYEYEYEEDEEQESEEQGEDAEEDARDASGRSAATGGEPLPALKVRTPSSRPETAQATDGGSASPPTAGDAADDEGAASAPRIKKPRSKQAADAARAEVIHQLDAAESRTAESFPYELPPLDLLLQSDDVSYEEHEKEVRRKARILEKTFRNFGFNVKVVEIETGPVIAQYEVQLEAGLRLSKITSLADDLAIALRVPSVRIVAPIPGKNTVGIEVPNEHRQLVRIREVIEETDGAARRMKIPIYLGKDVAGRPMTVDLAALPHLLIAGRTGTGKSVCLNSIIVSILMSRGPDEVRMLMIDPKMVELSGYKKLPHLMHPVVTDMRKAEAILAWAVDKMEERYALLARAGVRHVSVYNQLSEDELRERVQPESDEEWQQIPRNLPFIVIVADEMADLMMTSGKEVEQHIIRLAQKSRAVGIHLILATQKPTVDVITGLIKSNLPARIAFQVASRTDSRVVLDEMGADKLLGNGDMLFLSPGTSTLLRGQGTYLSDDEITRVTDFVATDQPQFARELIELKTKEEQDAAEKQGGFTKRDDLYEAAVDVVVRERRGSVSLLQRCLGIGYGRAARLIDYMAEDGIVGDYNGSQAREVVISVEDWESMARGGQAVPGDSGAPDAPARLPRPHRILPGADEPSDLEEELGSPNGNRLLEAAAADAPAPTGRERPLPAAPRRGAANRSIPLEDDAPVRAPGRQQPAAPAHDDGTQDDGTSEDSSPRTARAAAHAADGSRTARSSKPVRPAAPRRDGSDGLPVRGAGVADGDDEDSDERLLTIDPAYAAAGEAEEEAADAAAPRGAAAPRPAVARRAEATAAAAAAPEDGDADDQEAEEYEYEYEYEEGEEHEAEEEYEEEHEEEDDEEAADEQGDGEQGDGPYEYEYEYEEEEESEDDAADDDPEDEEDDQEEEGEAESDEEDHAA